MSNGSTGTYYVCHGIVRDDEVSRLPVLSSFHDGSTTELIRGNGLAAIVSVLQGEADPMTGEYALFADEDEVAELAKAHNRILVEAAEAVDVIPLQLGSAHSGHDAVCRMLDGQKDHFLTLFERISGAVEVAVKIQPDPARLLKNNTETDSAGSSSGGGRAYLMQRAQKKRAKENAAQMAHRVAERLFDTLLPATRELVAAEPKSDSPAICDLRCLVDRDGFDTFNAVLTREGDALAGEGFQLSATGPWAPYHFVRAA